MLRKYGYNCIRIGILSCLKNTQRLIAAYRLHPHGISPKLNAEKRGDPKCGGFCHGSLANGVILTN